MSQQDLATNKKIYLSSLGYTLGDLVDIRDLTNIPEEDQELLEALGLEKYSDSTLSSMELAYKSCKQTLETIELQDFSRIDGFIYVGDILKEISSEIIIGELLSKLNLPSVYPIGISLSDCADFVNAIRIAKSLITSGDFKNILIVASYKVKSGETRGMAQNLSILSDGAASCLVSSELSNANYDAYEIINTNLLANSLLWDKKPQHDFASFVKERSSGIRTTIQESLDRANLKPENFDVFLPNNYNLSLLRLFCECGRFTISQLYRDNLARFAHAYACDIIINLYDCTTESERIQPGSLLFLLGTGGINWGAMVLKKI